MLTPLPKGLELYKFPAIMGGVAATQKYAELSQANTTLGKKVLETSKTFGTNAVAGMAFHMLGASGQTLAKYTASKTGSRFLSYLANLSVNSLGFGGYTAGEELVNGEPLNRRKIVGSMGMGASLTVPQLAAVTIGAMVDRASSTSSANIKAIKKMNLNAEQILAKVQDIDQQIKEAAARGENTKNLETAKDLLSNMLVVNAGVDFIKENSGTIKEQADQSDLTDTEKETLKKRSARFKVQKVTPPKQWKKILPRCRNELTNSPGKKMQYLQSRCMS
jgi:hypothetical protein